MSIILKNTRVAKRRDIKLGRMMSLASLNKWVSDIAVMRSGQ